MEAAEFDSEGTDQIKVLFVSSNPIDQSHLRLDEEVRGIAEKLRGSKYRDHVELISEWAIRPSDLLRILNDHSPTVVHFSGHGSDSDELILQDDNGKTKSVSKVALMELFRIQTSGIKLVIFNACFTNMQANEITNYVPVTIGMNDSISDEAARIFSANFYQAIGYGKSVQTSFNQAIASLMLEDMTEEKTPELYVRPGMDAEKIFLVKQSIKNDRAQKEIMIDTL